MYKTCPAATAGAKKNDRLWSKIKKNWVLYLFVLPALIYLIIFKYIPMYGVLIAFKNFKPIKGIFGSPFTDHFGLAHFIRFFNLDIFWSLIKNTLVLSLYSLLAGFPLPIVLALLINSASTKRLAKTTQMITYAPHFISTVVMVGILNLIFSPQLGIASLLLNALGIIDGPLMVLASNSSFAHLYVWSGVWQGLGWGSIIYIASLSAVPVELHEAAIVDGATRFQRVLKIDLPTILPTMVIQLILNCGNILSVGFEKVYLMQNSLNIDSSEIISTYVYKMGLQKAQYSFSSAVGLFNAVINLIMLLTVNRAARALTQTSLF